MRESRKTERMQLPRDAMEEWLVSQTTKPSTGLAKRRTPAKDAYEAWIAKRVDNALKRRKVAIMAAKAAEGDGKSA